MYTQQGVFYFLKHWLPLSLCYALVAAASTVLLDLLRLRFIHDPVLLVLLHRAGDMTIIIILFLIRSWRIVARLAKIDEAEAYAYHQRVNVTQATEQCLSIMKTCQHYVNPEHEQCEAAIRQQLRAILSSLNHSPNPEVIESPNPVGAAPIQETIGA